MNTQNIVPQENIEILPDSIVLSGDEAKLKRDSIRKDALINFTSKWGIKFKAMSEQTGFNASTFRHKILETTDKHFFKPEDLVKVRRLYIEPMMKDLAMLQALFISEEVKNLK